MTLYIALFIALIALVGIVYGFATGFKDTTNPEQGPDEPAPPAADHPQQRIHRGRRVLAISAIVFILVALWYGFIYESPKDIEQRQTTQNTKACEDILAAYNASQQFVREYASTSNVEFPIVPKPESKVLNACEFKVLAVVYENTNEGEKKLPYEAILSYDTKEDIWHLQQLNIDGDKVVTQ